MVKHMNQVTAEDVTTEAVEFVVNDNNRDVLNDLHKYLMRSSGALDWNKGILLYGKVGSGKTNMLEVLRRCILELWRKELTIFTAQYIKSQFYEKDQDGYPMSFMVQNYKFIGINDIGLENRTQSGDDIIRNIIYERFERRKYTFGTMNLSLDQFKKRYEFDDGIGRMQDRFKHLFNYISLTGESFR